MLNLIDNMNLIEDGWAKVRRTIAPGTPEDQINDTRLVFFAGARHMIVILHGTKNEEETLQSLADELRSVAAII